MSDGDCGDGKILGTLHVLYETLSVWTGHWVASVHCPHLSRLMQDYLSSEEKMRGSVDDEEIEACSRIFFTFTVY